MLLVRLIQSLMNTAALPKTESSISNTPNTSKTVSIEALHHHTMTSNWGGGHFGVGRGEREGRGVLRAG